MINALVVDIENTICKPYASKPTEVDSSPYNPNNYLVSVGVKYVYQEDELPYFIFNHDELSDIDPQSLVKSRDRLQSLFDNTELLIGHNLKYDLIWLRESGFIYHGKVWDTMLAEYAMSRGLKRSLKLDDCVKRAGVTSSKLNTLQEAMSTGLNINQIPLDKLITYGKNDVDITKDLYIYQLDKLDTMGDKGTHLKKSIALMNDFLPVLVDIERAGVSIDNDTLNELNDRYKNELVELDYSIKHTVAGVMGDKPYNLNSNDDLSSIFYSRRPKDKRAWASIFNIGSEERNSVKKKKRIRLFNRHKGQYREVVQKHTSLVYRETASQCSDCSGTGYIQKTKVDGTPFLRKNKCKSCDGTGLVYTKTDTIAGFKLPSRNTDVTSSGWTTDKNVVEHLLSNANLPSTTRDFLTGIARYNKLTTWVNTFIAQIKTYQTDGLIHCNFGQSNTATGRLNASRPNMQNQSKRDPEFKLRKVFKSRWTNGRLYDADFGQLEFRIAAVLSGCKDALAAIESGMDIHSVTRDFFRGLLEYKPSIIKPNITRQEAKAETFGPLYGKHTEWTRQFYKLFPGIKLWHDKLMDEAVTTGEIRTPSGRIYAFPNAQWFTRADGETSCSFHTQIKNYPVQGFATGDVVLLVLIDVYDYLRKHNAKSKLILQVHDSALVDAHPDEFQLVESAFNFAFSNVYKHAEDRFNFTISVPLSFDLTYGDNWLEQKPLDIAS